MFRTGLSKHPSRLFCYKIHNRRQINKNDYLLTYEAFHHCNITASQHGTTNNCRFSTTPLKPHYFFLTMIFFLYHLPHVKIIIVSLIFIMHRKPLFLEVLRLFWTQDIVPLSLQLPLVTSEIFHSSNPLVLYRVKNNLCFPVYIKNPIDFEIKFGLKHGFFLLSFYIFDWWNILLLKILTLVAKSIPL